MNKNSIGILKVVPIEKIIEETPASCRIPVKSFELKISEIANKAYPGQFAMLWLLDIDEKPMGIASVNQKNNTILFTIAKVGKTTSLFHQLNEGNLLGVRGPYGKGFTLLGKKIAIVGGGTGIAPIRFLTEKALEKNLEVTLFHGARTIAELAFKGHFENLAKKNSKLIYKPSTDDSTCGFGGFSTECFDSCLDKGEMFDHVYTCGPELMMHTTWKLAESHKIPTQACLADRYFKCAIGLCGQCTVDPVGYRLCIDGPVFNQDQLKKISDFGKYARDEYGKKIPF